MLYQSGFLGLKRIKCLQRATPIAAAPITVPGWPPLNWKQYKYRLNQKIIKLTACVRSAPRIRMVLRTSFSVSDCNSVRSEIY
jgi:hypothetical protein